METFFFFPRRNCTHAFKSYYVVWKRKTLDTSPDIVFMFKSYYVVWKLNKIGDGNTDTSSLNRTMQYGNFFHSHVIFFILLFKSYYVVWKLFSSQIVCSRFSQFKSYYVVWKLCFFSSSVIMFFRLDRTMQYGNICEKIQTVKCRRV